MWSQYTIMDCHVATNTGSLWVLHLQPDRFQGIKFDYFQSQTTVLFGIGKLIGGRGVMGR